MKSLIKNRILIIVSFFVLFAVLLVCVLVSEHNSISTIKFIVKDNNSSNSVSLFKSDDGYYAFLPSHTTLDKISIMSTSGYRIKIDDKALDSEFFCSDFKYDTEYKISLLNSFGIMVAEEKLTVLKSASIPSLYIDLTDGVIADIDNDKTINKTGTLITLKDDGYVDFNGSFKDIHSRGKASYSSPKKSYTIEFAEDVNLLGMGNASKWVLSANSYDPSNLKNKIVYEASGELGMRYFCDSEYVDLYVDGEYRGLYLLVEKISIGSDRIEIENLEELTQDINFKSLSSYNPIEITNAENGCQMLRAYGIPNNPDDITGGYIIKSEILERIADDSLFVTQNGGVYDCESPRYATVEQMNYISSLFQNVENSLDDYKKVSELIDIDSFVKRYLIQECFANVEGSSYYYIKDADSIDGKIYAEPVWDFDNSLGTGDTEDPTGVYCKSYIFDKLITNEAFKEKVIFEYSEKFDTIFENCKLKIFEYSDRINCSDKMNKIRWKNIYGEEDSLEICTQKLSEYLLSRKLFLNDFWLNGTEYINVVFDDPENIIDYYKSYSIKVGEKLPDIEMLERKGYVFLEWFNSETGEELDIDASVYENCTYYAKWEKDPSASDSLFVQGDVVESLYLIKEQILKEFDFYAGVILAVLLPVMVIFLFVINRPKKRK